MKWLIDNEVVSHDVWSEEKDYQILLFGRAYLEKQKGIRNLITLKEKEVVNHSRFFEDDVAVKKKAKVKKNVEK